MAKKPKKQINASEWLNTYADMITLILCFFVLLFSMSSIQEEKWTEILKGFNPDSRVLQEILEQAGEGTGTNGGDGTEAAEAQAAMNGIYDLMKTYIEEKGLTDSIELYNQDGIIFINFRGHIFFDGDSYVLRQEGKDILDALSGAMAGLDQYIGQVRVMGHTTQYRPGIPNNVYNDRMLSSNRATEVLVYLQNKDIVKPGKLVSEGYGQHFPIAPFDTEENMSKNRRVEILIAQSNAVDTKLEEVYEKLGMRIYE